MFIGSKKCFHNPRFGGADVDDFNPNLVVEKRCTFQVYDYRQGADAQKKGGKLA